MSGEIATRKLADLITKLEEGSIHKVSYKHGMKHSVLGDKGAPSPLPTLKGLHGGVVINLDFSPYPEGGHFVSIEACASCPFKLILSHEGQEVKSMKYKQTHSIPASEIEIGVKDFDDRYFIETLEEEPVRKFLSDGGIRGQIDSLGDFDRLTFQSKHLKLVYYVPDVEKLDSDWLFKMIEILIGLAGKLK
jgi:hypothetical protein